MVEDARWRRGEITRSVGAALHLRRTFPELEETILRSHDLFPAVDPGANYDKMAHTWTFSSGYRFVFRGMEGEHDYFKFRSNQYTHISFDELTSFTEGQYRYMGTRLRTADPVLLPMLALRSSTTPEGEGLMWVRKRFIDPYPEGRKVIRTWVTVQGQRVPRDRIFIPCRLEDNHSPGFREQYEAELQDKPAHIRDALLHGNWYVVANAYFAEEWIPDVHVCDPFPIPPGWYKFRSGDYGYKKPACVLWWAVDPDGNFVCYRELYVVKHDAEQLAFRIREIEDSAKEWDPSSGSKLRGPLDLSCWARGGTVGPTIAETMFQVGVWWDKSTKDRLAGSRELMKRLKARTGPGKTPGIRFFKNCRNAIRTIPGLPADKENAEVPQDGGDDHCFDAAYYAAMSRPFVPDAESANRQPYDDDELAERRRHRLERQKPGGRFGYGGF